MGVLSGRRIANEVEAVVLREDRRIELQHHRRASSRQERRPTENVSLVPLRVDPEQPGIFGIEGSALGQRVQPHLRRSPRREVAGIPVGQLRAFAVDLVHARLPVDDQELDVAVPLAHRGLADRRVALEAVRDEVQPQQRGVSRLGLTGEGAREAARQQRGNRCRTDVRADVHKGAAVRPEADRVEDADGVPQGLHLSACSLQEQRRRHVAVRRAQQVPPVRRIHGDERGDLLRLVEERLDAGESSLPCMFVGRSSHHREGYLRLEGWLPRTIRRLVEGERARMEDQRRAGAGLEREQSVVALVEIPGVAAGEIVSRAYSKASLLRAGDGLLKPGKTRDRILALKHDPDRKIALVTGVVPFGLLRANLPENTRYVTMLRHPVDRVLAHYRSLASDLSLEDALAEGGPLPDNLATRMLCGLEAIADELPPGALESATRNLRESFELAGIEERLEESVALLERALGRDLRATAETIRSRTTVEQPSEQERRLIEKRNRLDLELHAAAQELLDAAIARVGLNLEAAAGKLSGAPLREGEPRASAATAQPKRTTRPGRVPSSRALVAHVDVPGTAGRLMLSGYVPYTTLRLGNSLVDPDGALTQVRQIVRSKRKHVKAVTAVVPFGALRAHLPEGTRYITMLREPTLRTFAHYRLLVPRRQKVGTDSPPTLEGAIGEGLLPDNLTTRMLCGIAKPGDELPPDALSAAKRHVLDEFELVGIGEHLEESLALLQRLLGRELGVYMHELLREVDLDSEPPPEDKRQLLEEHNRLDLELYAFARDLLEEKIRAAVDLESDVRVVKANLSRDKPARAARGRVRGRNAKGPVVYLDMPGTVELTFPASSTDAPRALGDVTLDPVAALARTREVASEGGAVVAVGVVPLAVLRELFPRGTRFVTVLRDPAHRVLSHYYALLAAQRRRPRRLGRIQLSGSSNDEEALQAMLETGSPLFTNLATRLLSDSRELSDPLRPGGLDTAKGNIEELFDLVGIAERLPETSVLLAGLPAFETVRMLRVEGGVTGGERPSPTESGAGSSVRSSTRSRPQAARLVEEYNELDADLYHFARGLFAKRVTAQGADLTDALRDAKALEQREARKAFEKRFPLVAAVPAAPVRLSGRRHASQVDPRPQRTIRAGGPDRPGEIRLFGFPRDMLDEIVELAPLLDVRVKPPPLYRFENLIYRPGADCLYDDAGVPVLETGRFRGPAFELTQKAPPIIPVPRRMPNIPEPVLYFGGFRRHYGLFLTEGISRLWPLASDQVEEGTPLVGGLGPTVDEAPFIFRFLDGAGIRPDRITHFRELTLLRKVYVPHASFSIRAQAFAEHAAVPLRFAKRVLGRDYVQRSEPLYLSRSRLAPQFQRQRGEEGLEEALRKEGVRVEHPETLTFDDQVRLVNEHSVVIGHIGSAFHTLLFAFPDRPRRSVLFTNHLSASQANYFLIDLLKGLRADYVLVENTDRTIKGPATLDVETTLSWLRALAVL